jgi:hypothetical protein
MCDQSFALMVNGIYLYVAHKRNHFGVFLESPIKLSVVQKPSNPWYFIIETPMHSTKYIKYSNYIIHEFSPISDATHLQ